MTEPATGRTYFLDYPCNLKRGEKVTLVLSLHGGGSYGNWQRHYFPLLDYVGKYRLVVATPFSRRRVWTADDDAYLQNIVSSVIQQGGREQIKGFWLAGHSQGGLDQGVGPAPEARESRGLCVSSLPRRQGRG